MREISTPPPPLGQADWMLLTREEAARALGVGRSTFYDMITNKIIPDGIRIFGRDKRWRVDIIREVAERMYRGEFTGIKIRKKEAAS